MATNFYNKIIVGGGNGGGGGGGGGVNSVNGYTGTVVLGKGDIGLNNVDNTSDANKPISTATQTALNGKLDLTGGSLTGSISATNLSGTNTGDETNTTIKTKLGSASTSSDGYLTSTDWTTFNAKQAALGYTPVNKAGDTITGPLIVSGSAGTGSSMMRITNTGLGDCFVVEDSANPDSSPFKIDSSGFIYSGSLLSTTGVSGRMQILDSNNSFVECIAGSTRAVSFGASTTGNGFRSVMGPLDISTSLSSDGITITPAAEDAFGSAIYCKSTGSALVTGINNATPTEALDVTGNIKASGTILGSNISNTNTGDETNATIKTKLGAASSSQDGYLTSANWTTFNNKANTPFIALMNGAEIWRGYTYQNNSTTVTVDNIAAQATNGSITARSFATTNQQTKMVRIAYAVSVPAANGVCGVRATQALWTVGSGFKFETTFAYTDSQYNSGALQFYGMTASTGGITISSTASVSSLLNMIGIGSDAGDTALSIFNNAAGTSTKTTLSATDFPCNRTAGAASTDIFQFVLYNAVGSSSVLYQVTNLTTGVVATGTLSSNLPASTTGLTFQAIRTSGSSSNACSMDLTKIGCYSLV